MLIEIIAKGKNKFQNSPSFEFHIASKLRRLYEVSDELFSISGNIVFANFGQVRKFVNNFNKSKNDKEKLKVSEVSAAGLMDEIFHYVIRRYESELNPKAFSRAIDYLEKEIGEEEFRKLLFEFIELFLLLKFTKEILLLTIIFAPILEINQTLKLLLKKCSCFI